MNGVDDYKEMPEMINSDGEDWDPNASNYDPLAKFRKQRREEQAARRAAEPDSSDSEDEFPELTQYLNNNDQDNPDNVECNPETVGNNMNEHTPVKTEIEKFIVIWFYLITIWTSLQNLGNNLNSGNCEQINALGNEDKDAKPARSMREVLQDKIRKIRYRLRRGHHHGFGGRK